MSARKTAAPPTNAVTNPKSPRRPASPAIGAQWRDRITAILTKGIADLADSALPLPRRVQKGRQSTKAARALLRMAPPGLKRQARGLTLALATVRRRLAEVRDVDALNEALAAVAGDAGLSELALRRLHKSIAGTPSSTATIADALAEASAMLRKIIAQIARWSVPAQRDVVLLDAIADDYRRLKRDANGGLESLDVEALHDLRKRVITHRHQLAFLAGLPGARHDKTMRRVERARKLHEAIGNHRDLDLLTAALDRASLPKSAPARAASLKLRAAIAAQQAKELGRAVRLAGKVLKKPVKAYRPQPV